MTLFLSDTNTRYQVMESHCRVVRSKCDDHGLNVQQSYRYTAVRLSNSCTCTEKQLPSEDSVTQLPQPDLFAKWKAPGDATRTVNAS